MTLLSLDSSSEILSVALAVYTADRREHLAERSVDAGLGHARRVMPMIHELLHASGRRPGELDAIVVGAGPGSFTGLRIAFATAKGLAAGSGAPYLGVSSLEAFAAPYAQHPGLVLPVLDARKRRYYAMLMHQGRRLSDELDLGAADLAHAAREAALRRSAACADTPVLLTGPGAVMLYNELGDDSRFLPASDPRRPPGAALIELALPLIARGAYAGPDAGPIYIRKSEAEIGILRKADD